MDLLRHGVLRGVAAFKVLVVAHQLGNVEPITSPSVDSTLLPLHTCTHKPHRKKYEASHDDDDDDDDDDNEGYGVVPGWSGYQE